VGLRVLGGVFLAGAAACSQTSGSVPPELRGTWAFDCSAPQVRFDSRGYYDERTRRGFGVEQVVRRGDEYDVHWRNPEVQKVVVDTYSTAGGGLHLVKTTVEGKLVAEFRWKPWKRCD
jgi:hypothetical protein